ncbi:D-arabinose 1-dehydrogenase-like Zn-dependent alcohol dehydrogenase [Kribbella sp. VKM Ac-2527]|uniref:D-arabinose 1-dehydrogenase-like Zn-dependent alcohol dehydrogenase n=1 Tax=Kribbella caucasensis TaxID=2512215 RepID=A0A4R6KPR3_9ACTN|nr:alcohol dehydrogenase catalytic domain-containing protein [Kribbella sp. VKM Ac-2527]TDO51589.1 D-arabinose 1-dehydrogenase-like Zn-dependent alcohol dehydrogenase [Kribbella sp. VKM Ac-2527]
MQAIVFYGERELNVETLDDPVPGQDQVVIEIKASGMCGSDLHTFRGPRLQVPTIAGHEPAGVVVASGSQVSGEWVGRPVMVHHYFGCGRCDQCRTGWTQMCRNGATAMGATAPGSHAQYVSVPISAVLPMPEGLTYLAAAAISCGTGTAWGALKRLQLRGDDTIAVFGQGPVGLAATQLASALGARVIALDISPARLERARAFGAWETLNPAEIDSVPEGVRDLTGGRGVSKSLETSGASSAAQAALQVLDLWGVACWVGVGSTIHFDLTEHLYKQVTGVPSWTLSVQAMDECANYVVQRGIDVDALFTDRWRLEEAVPAYELSEKQTSGKGAFTP